MQRLLFSFFAKTLWPWASSRLLGPQNLEVDVLQLSYALGRESLVDAPEVLGDGDHLVLFG